MKDTILTFTDDIRPNKNFFYFFLRHSNRENDKGNLIYLTKSILLLIHLLVTKWAVLASSSKHQSIKNKLSWNEPRFLSFWSEPGSAFIGLRSLRSIFLSFFLSWRTDPIFVLLSRLEIGSKNGAKKVAGKRREVGRHLSDFSGTKCSPFLSFFYSKRTHHEWARLSRDRFLRRVAIRNLEATVLFAKCYIHTFDVSCWLW